jgi:hypothetical protein
MNSESSFGQRTWWRSPVVNGSNDRGGPVDIGQPDEEHLPRNIGSFPRAAQDLKY